MVLGPLEFMNNADLKKVNDIIVFDVFIMSEITIRTNNLKIPYTRRPSK